MTGIRYLKYFVVLILSMSLCEAREPIILKSDNTEVTSLAFTPNSDQLYSTALKNDHIWSLKTGQSIGPITGARGHCIAFSPDGKQYALSGFKTTSLYKTSSGEKLWTLEIGPPQYSLPFLHAVAFSPDGNTVATTGSSATIGGRHGRKAGIIKIFAPETGEELRTLPLTSTVASQIACPDSRFLAAGTVGAGGELTEPGELLIWRIQTGELKHRLKHKANVQPVKDQGSVTGVAFHPNGKEIAIASSDGTVRVWDLNTETIQLTLKGHEKSVRRVTYSPDGTRLASAGRDQTVRIWDAKDGTALESLPIDCKKVNAVVFSPDGKWLAAGGGDFLRSGTIQLWESPFGED